MHRNFRMVALGNACEKWYVEKTRMTGFPLSWRHTVAATQRQSASFFAARVRREAFAKYACEMRILVGLRVNIRGISEKAGPFNRCKWDILSVYSGGCAWASFFQV